MSFWYNQFVDSQTLQTKLAGLPVPEVHYFQSIGSTNDFALQLAEQGAPDGTLVAANEQTAGRGRLERRWVTRPGGALAFTLVLRPTPQERTVLGLFAPLCGLAVALALEGIGLEAEIKWPNDVLLGRKKTCGVLMESHWQGERLTALAAGIGVNIATSSVPSRQEVLFPATCMEEALGHPADREALLVDILAQFFYWRPLLESPRFLQAWETRLAFQGEWVTIHLPEQEINGVILGVAANGSLRLRLADNTEYKVQAGDVRLRPVRR